MSDLILIYWISQRDKFFVQTNNETETGMIIIDRIIGNIADPKWKSGELNLEPDILHLDFSEAQKNRLRKSTNGGIEIAIALPRHLRIHDGDILYIHQGTGQLVIARIKLPEVMAIDFINIEKLSKDEILTLGFQLGHAFGNQHWPSVIKGNTIYVPISVDRKVMLSAMHTHNFDHIDISFHPGEDISELLSNSEFRLLFGGIGATSHTHTIPGTKIVNINVSNL